MLDFNDNLRILVNTANCALFIISSPVVPKIDALEMELQEPTQAQLPILESQYHRAKISRVQWMKARSRSENEQKLF